MRPLGYACDDCQPEYDLERSMGLCDNVFWLEALIRWFSSAPIG